MSELPVTVAHGVCLSWGRGWVRLVEHRIRTFDWPMRIEPVTGVTMCSNYFGVYSYRDAYATNRLWVFNPPGTPRRCRKCFGEASAEKA